MKRLLLTNHSVVRYGQETTFIPIPQKVAVTKATEPNWLAAVKAAQAKKAQDIVVLDLKDITSFTDYFIICTGSSSRQNQAISDEIHLTLKDQHNELPTTVEGYDNAEWVLQDYGDFIVHIFLDRTRSYYDLERLWRDAKKVALPAEAA